ncbi:MAG: hypothetical protein WCM76_07885 [Bacteroidota bacterium]
MRSKIVFFLIVFMPAIFASAQKEVAERVPKQRSLEIGYRYVFSDNFPNTAIHGTSFMFDYAWQVSGFNKHKAIFITIPIGYTYTFGLNKPGDKDMRIVSYGWTIRHELAKNRKSIPFLGYALLFDQLAFNGTEGGIMGHQTRFEFGYNFRCDKRLKYFVKAEYSYASFASLGVKKRKSLQFVEIKSGIRF